MNTLHYGDNLPILRFAETRAMVIDSNLHLIYNINTPPEIASPARRPLFTTAGRLF